MTVRLLCFKCNNRRKRCVWLIDHHPYCNSCGAAHMESRDIFELSIHRLTDCEKWYEDRRRPSRSVGLMA